MAYRTEQETDALKQQFLNELRLKALNVHQACSATGISRRTYYNWLKDDLVFSQGVSDVAEDVKDQMESMLVTIGGGKKGNPTAVLGWLNARAKDRGYGHTRVEHMGRLTLEDVVSESMKGSRAAAAAASGDGAA